MRVQADGPPGLGRRVPQGFVVRVHPVGPVMRPQVMPQVLHRVQLRRVRQRPDQAHVRRHHEPTACVVHGLDVLGLPPGSDVLVAVRPERIQLAAPATGENVFTAQVLRDRFYGATRQIEVIAGNGRLEVETAARDPVAGVHVPRDAIQFLHNT